MKISVQLEKQLPDIVEKNVNLKNIVIGKVIEYDTKTGWATIEIEIDDYLFSKLDWNPITESCIDMIHSTKSITYKK